MSRNNGLCTGTLPEIGSMVECPEGYQSQDEVFHNKTRYCYIGSKSEYLDLTQTKYNTQCRDIHEQMISMVAQVEWNTSRLDGSVEFHQRLSAFWLASLRHSP